MTGETGLPSDADPDRIREALVEWYRDDHRAFPWRETDDPYGILVSEVMSQQTQLDRVVDAWEAFLDRWPTVEALAAADRADVVGFWTDHSLGYNNRAAYLHEAARQIVEGEVGPASSEGGDGDTDRNGSDGNGTDADGDEVDGDEVDGNGTGNGADANGTDAAPEAGAHSFPRDPDELSELMGVGPYTANAVASFAFDNGNAVVDTNVKRVLYRAFGVDGSDTDVERVAQALMPEGESRVWNNAIMELGGVACQKTPRCDGAECPWREWCRAYRTGDFTAPDVPTQPEFEGSRRQMRGRVLSALKQYGELAVDDLGPRVRVDYAPDGEYGREWLRGLLSDLADDGLVELREGDRRTVARLRR